MSDDSATDGESTGSDGETSPPQVTTREWHATAPRTPAASTSRTDGAAGAGAAEPSAAEHRTHGSEGAPAGRRARRARPRSAPALTEPAGAHHDAAAGAAGKAVGGGVHASTAWQDTGGRPVCGAERRAAQGATQGAAQGAAQGATQGAAETDALVYGDGFSGPAASARAPAEAGELADDGAAVDRDGARAGTPPQAPRPDSAPHRNARLPGADRCASCSSSLCCSLQSCYN